MRTRKTLSALMLAVSMLSYTLSPAYACGPFFADADFSYDSNPDLPLKKFIGGSLGVVKPTFAKTYLVVAYRYLNGKPLTAAQQDAVQALLINRLDVAGKRNNLNSSPIPTMDSADSAVANWTKAHNKVSGVSTIKDVDTSRQVMQGEDGMGENYLNCTDDSFLTATNTLQAKIAKHGANSPFVKNWLVSQDSVFCHCGGNQYDLKTKKYAKEPGFPVLSQQETDPEAKFDRNYQLAAAHFYAQQFDAAFKEFSAIANETASPYAAVSRYMTARCLIRKANIVKMDAAAKTNELEAALKILTEVTSNNTAPYQAYHLPAQKLISLVNGAIHPDKQINILGRYLATTDDDKGFQQALDDYTILLHHAEGFSDDYYDPQSDKASYPKTAAEDDLTNWVSNFQVGAYGQQAKAFKTAEAEYEKNHSLAWLLVALTYAPFDKAKTANLITAAKAVPSSSKAYMPINYAAAKLLVGEHDSAGANSLIATLESAAKSEHLPSSVNALMDLRAKLPMSIGDFVANAVRIPASYSINMDYLDDEVTTVHEKPKPLAPAFSTAGGESINESMPTSILANMCGDSKLPSILKLNLAQAVFVRSILLEDQDALKKSTDVLTQLGATNASLKSVKQLMPNVLSTSGADQKFAAAYLMLHNPGFEPFVTSGAQRPDAINELDEYNNNWWDTPPQPTANPSTDAFDKLPNYPGLLTPAQKTQGAGEIKKIIQLGSGPTCLGQIVCNYAIAHPTDSRVPEALAKVVWATHYGSKDKQTTKYSKQAFDLLHQKYPKSPFTAKTPYHY